MHESVKRAIVLLLAVILVGTILLFGYSEAEKRSRPVFRILTNNRTEFSDVFVLIDGTNTMSDSDFLNAKQIVSERILSSLGINDTASGFALDGSFQDSKSAVFGISDHQPSRLASPDAQKILNLVKAKGDLQQPRVCDEDTFKLIQQLKAQQTDADSKRDDWQKRVNSLGRPAVDGSDYVAALEGINRLMNNHKKEPGRETWLIVVGDLKHESSTHLPVHGDDTAFKNFNHKLLVYPFNSNDPKWPATEKFWETHFGNIEFEKHTFAEVLRKDFLIKPNPTSGFETNRGENFILVFLPFGIGAAVICLAALFLFSRVGKHSREREASVSVLS